MRRGRGVVALVRFSAVNIVPAWAASAFTTASIITAGVSPAIRGTSRTGVHLRRYRFSQTALQRLHSGLRFRRQSGCGKGQHSHHKQTGNQHFVHKSLPFLFFPYRFGLQLRYRVPLRGRGTGSIPDARSSEPFYRQPKPRYHENQDSKDNQNHDELGNTDTQHTRTSRRLQGILPFIAGFSHDVLWITLAHRVTHRDL